MVTAVDTNVLLDVFLDDIEYRQSSFEALTAAFSAGDVIVSDIVWAETGAAFENNATFEVVMQKLGIKYVALTQSAATHASELWRVAKARKSIPPKRVVADFLVGAHALECADRLLTRDHGFYRDYFKGLEVVDPSKPI